MNEVTHVECGGTVMYRQRVLAGAEHACAVLECQRCGTVIQSTSELHPQGAVCGVDFVRGPDRRRVVRRRQGSMA